MTVGQRICVIIPAFNEEKAIGKVIRDIPTIVEFVIVCNNGSTDNTADVATQAGAIVVDEPRRGYGWACLKGIEKAAEFSPEIVVFLDGDYSDYPHEIPLLIEPLEDGKFEMVIGSRVLGKREKGSLTPQQVFGNWLATRLMRLFYGVRYTDLGPFRAIRWDALKQLGISDKTYGWTIEMQIKAAKKKIRSTEIPVDYRKRIGKSKVSGTVKGSVLAGIKIIFAIIKYRF
jgi:glycosyltransferase involved in cell wall biosynthesis